MTQTIISTAITFIVSSILGYCVSVIRNYKSKLKNKSENEKVQNEALKILLQTQLTNMYFVYAEMGEISDYMLKNWNNLFKIYKKLGGNDYCDMLSQKMKSWKIVKTDILDKWSIFWYN